MSISINAKGTTVPYFTIGKNGTTIYQGTADPSGSYTIKNGDYWFNSTASTLNVRVSNVWSPPGLGVITFPSGTGTSGQVLSSNGSGALSWTTVAGVGTLDISSGGTNATTAAGARTNLGISTGITSSQILPSGTTAQRDGTPSAGYIRFNSTLLHYEGYNGTTWAPLAARNTWNSGDVIQEVVYTDAGATTSSTTYTNLNASVKNITARSTNSSILVSVTFQGGINPLSATNTYGTFQLYEATLGLFGPSPNFQAPSGSGGTGVFIPAALSAIYTNSTQSLKQFSIQGKSSHSGTVAQATQMVWSIREIQN
jgi:hypothetical protein